MINFFLSIVKLLFNPIIKKFKNRNLESLDKSIILNAKKLINSQNYTNTNINDYEFSAFSQWGEDGIINYLTEKLNIKNKIFIEFGVENYLESNTRFLMMNKNWSGLIIDGNKKNIQTIRELYFYWRYSLTAVNNFITTSNINNIFIENGFEGRVGLLSIDIDGNDYWIWESINKIDPDIVIIEYNSRFGSEESVTIPYQADFDRKVSDFSMIYYGASLSALTKLSNKKGYALVGTNLAGNNAFYVKRNLLNESIQEKKVSECFREAKFREMRDVSGKLLFKSSSEEKEYLKNKILKRV